MDTPQTSAPALFKIINPYELIVDFSLLAFFVLLNVYVIPPGQTLLNVFNSTGLAMVILLIDITVPMYMAGLRGSILAGARRFRKSLSRVLGFFMVTTTLTLAFFFPFFLYRRGNLEEFAFLLLLIPGLVSVIMGVAADVPALQNGKNDEENPFLFFIMMVLLILTVLLGIIYMITFFANSKIWYGLLTIAGMILSLIGISYLCMEVLEKVFQTALFRNYLQPVMTMILVLFWQELFFDLMAGSKAGHSPWGLLVYALSGILPLRLMIAFEPPVKPINVFIGLGTIGYISYSMMLP